ncbi:GNAT family N-acetyltransferase [Alistipes sp.]|uniref:GNAT family N-acetyltransferase n=1 Tax=Alistipes sp. TaxID=1872444 RepID=UPI003AF0C638
MEFRIQPFDRMTPAELHAAARLRQAVFYLEQRVDCEDLDDLDPHCLFLRAVGNGETIGVLRIVPPGVIRAEASIGRVAVASQHRRRGVARAMMRAALDYIGRTWGTPVCISAQSHLVPFYRQLGFEAVSDVYLEAGIPHRKMILEKWHA